MHFLFLTTIQVKSQSHLLLAHVVDESAEAVLPLFWGQSGVSGKILHDVEVAAHLISQT